MDSVFFLDSAGNAWETCGADDNDAVAFGPLGCARRVPEEAYIAWINDGMGEKNDGMGEKELAEAQAWLDAAEEKLRLAEEEFDISDDPEEARRRLEIAEKEYQAAVENMVIVRGG